VEKFSYLKSINADYIDELFERYRGDPDSVDETWRYFFDGLELGAEEAQNGRGLSQPTAAAPSTNAPAQVVGAITPQGSVDFGAEAKVAELITAYRELGRMLADIDPLGAPPTSHPLLDLARFELAASDLGRPFHAGKLIGMGVAKLSDIIARLRETYCGKIGVEFTHIQATEERNWLQSKMELSRNREALDPATRQLILKRLTESEGFERFLHTRYVAQKRFSVEGGEGVIPALDCMMETGAELGAKEFVIGMAHRGRLNVLTNIFGKKPEYIFTEFEGTYKTDTSLGEGDVKYHMGYSADFTTRFGKPVHLSLGFNPSHLEFVNAVAEGVTRAKQTFTGDKDRTKVVPILIHGDAAFAGQGVCYETLNLSQLEGYATGGTLHIVINNQVGFTTSPKDARSTTYSTDLAKMLESPIFHVNGDDPEAIWYVSKLCTEYRQKFRKDIFIDLVCYRRHGHNEGDEPSFTQPMLYKKIKEHATPREVYAKRLAAEGAVSDAETQALWDKQTELLTQAQAIAKAEAPHPEVSCFEGRWKGLKRGTDADSALPVATQVDEKTIKDISARINTLPASFHLHSKLNRFFEARLKAVQDGKGIDWGNGELLAYATLLNEGIGVRLSGQDVERGTFTHRHSVVNDFETGESYTPINHLKEGQPLFQVHNSHLSETGVMGFEYGYSIADPKTLVIWEAQFGDFANGAQVIIDQFLSSSESKWQRMSGLVLLLPHAFEGQGPEHSSARLERFLQLCGRNNLQVGNFTTPAQIFHALRRQVKRDFRKPLVVMSPKSLLRHPMATSTLDEFTKAGFQEAIDDATMAGKGDKVRKVLLCSGKVYYDLLAARTEKKLEDVALVRVEQLYPWPAAQLAKILKQYPKAKLSWVQEEPRNMGAWSYVFGLWAGGTGDFAAQADSRAITYIGRELAASPAVGSAKVHAKEQAALIDLALS
jgi:2-oxoglutarate dehydrogenase E1 component